MEKYFLPYSRCYLRLLECSNVPIMSVSDALELGMTTTMYSILNIAVFLIQYKANSE